jgi:hypothetical protein
VIYILIQEVKKMVVTLVAIQAVILVVILEETPEEIQVVTQELVNLKKNLLNLLCQILILDLDHSNFLRQ